MKRYAFLIPVIFGSFVLLSLQFRKSPEYVKLNARLFAAKHEVTNAQYQSFLDAQKPADALRYFPDTNAWVSKLTSKSTSVMADKYHRHPVYNSYPVVNINKTAMEAYCVWQTQQYMLQKKRAFQKVLFRLPTEQEWQQLANPLPSHNLPWYGSFPYKTPTKKGGIEFMANLKMKDYKFENHNYISDGSFYPCAVKRYPSNSIGLYDVIGNVAEFTQEGTARGGSWDNFLAESTVDQNQEYALPDPRVGFRVVMEILEY
jgi:formylglycine-generating enzyme required for sulfatase activity